MNLGASDQSRLEQILVRRRVQCGTPLYRAGDRFKFLYAVHFGHFKSTHLNPGGEQQNTGFQMAGEMLGIDAIGAEQHGGSAIALEDSEVCGIPFLEFQQLCIQIPALLHHFHQAISVEIARMQHLMLLRGTMQAERRLADFLCNHAARYAARGLSPSRFQLRMAREDIGNYLALSVESVSRAFSHFKKNNWLTVDNRNVEILDSASLNAIASGLEPGKVRILSPSAIRQIDSGRHAAGLTACLSA